MLQRCTCLILLWLAAIGLAGCVGPKPNSQVFLSDDEFTKTATLIGIEQVVVSSDVEKQDWFLRTFIDKTTHHFSHNLYLGLTYPGGTNGSYTASDDTARSLRVGTIERDSCYFGKCPRTDTLQIEIPDEVLRERAQQGMRIKVVSRFGYSVLLAITSDMMRSQLIALDTYLHGGPLPRMPETAKTPIADLPVPPAPANPGPHNDVPYSPDVPNPDAPGQRRAPEYSVKENGVGIGAIPMLMSKIRPGAADGLMVASVAKGSPADLAGIRIGDVMTSFNGHSLTDILTAAGEYKAAADDVIAKAKPNSVVPIELQRGTTRMKLEIHL